MGEVPQGSIESGSKDPADATQEARDDGRKCERRRVPRASEPPPLILVVEDDPGSRAGLAELLVDAGYRVRTASDGAQALDLLASVGADLVISDVKMPGIDGFELTARLCALRADVHLPVILVSALGEPQRRITGLDVGADDYLTKPIDIDELLARVRVQLRHASHQRELVQRAQLDELTGLLNRRGILALLQEQLGRVGREGGVLSVVLIDVNDFKLINDRYGHLVGDVVLRRVGHALAAQVREDDQVGRLGGDEFLIVVPGEDSGGAARMVRRMGDLRSLPQIHALGIDHAVTVAAGAATAAPGDTVEQLVERADQDMFRDKGRSLHR